MISHDPDLRRLAGRDVAVERPDRGGAAARSISVTVRTTAPSPRRSTRSPTPKFNIDIKDERGGRAARSRRSETPARRRGCSSARSARAPSRRRSTELPGVATSISMIRGACCGRDRRRSVGLVGLAAPDRCATWMPCSCPRASFGFAITTPRTIRRIPRGRRRGARLDDQRTRGRWTRCSTPASTARHRSRRPRDRSCWRARRADTPRGLAKHPQAPVKALETAGSRHFHGHPVVIPDLAVSPDSTRVRRHVVTYTCNAEEATQWRIVVCAECDLDLRACRAKRESNSRPGRRPFTAPTTARPSRSCSRPTPRCPRRGSPPAPARRVASSPTTGAS